MTLYWLHSSFQRYLNSFVYVTNEIIEISIFLGDPSETPAGIPGIRVKTGPMPPLKTLKKDSGKNLPDFQDFASNSIK